MNPLQFIGALFVLAFAGIPAFLFTVYPERIVGAQAGFHRKVYKDALHLSDEQIDKIPQFPTDKFFVGPRSDYVNRAPEHPEEFEREVFGVRMVGILFGWIFLVFLMFFGGFL